MRISARGRYALSAMTDIALHSADGERVTAVSVAERLGISKIYLEQVFSLLKKGGLVNSVKGAQGGYQLARAPRLITAYDILLLVETALFEESERAAENAPEMDEMLKRTVFDPLREAVADALRAVTLEMLRAGMESSQSGGFMFYI